MATGQEIVDYARAEIGDPYVFGAAGPRTFDCSGLVQYVYKHFGLTTPRTTYQMTGKGSPLLPIARNQLQAGDLIFSNWDGEAPHSHVGIYTGHGTIIEAPEPGKTVTETRLDPLYWAHTDAYRRVPGLSGASAQLVSAQSGPGIPGPLPNLDTSGVPSIVGGILQEGWSILQRAQDVTSALQGIGEGVLGAAQSLAEVAGLAEQVGKLFLPSNLLRTALFIFGMVFVLIGIWFLAREVRNS